MIKVAVFFGGDSVESDISVITGIGALSSLDASKYDGIAVYVRDNKFWVVESRKALSVSTYTKFNKSDFKEIYISNKRFVYAKSKFKEKVINIDVALLCMHGGVGENGGLQGVLETFGIPYTSTDIARSAICMDKTLTHENMTKIGVKNVNYKLIDDKVTEEQVGKIFEEFNCNVVVKPNSLGSSVGVQAVSDSKQIYKAIQNALRYDKYALIEQKVDNLIEFNCAAILSNGEILISDVDIPVRSKEILDFGDKYLIFDGKAKQGKFEIPTDLRKMIVKTTKLVYEQLGLFGVVRIDYLYDSVYNELYLNEINTIPGSLAYYLFANGGLDLMDLTDMLITEGIRRYKENFALIKRFDSSLLTLSENSSPKLLQKFHKWYIITILISKIVLYFCQFALCTAFGFGIL